MKILVAVDGSKPSIKAVEFALNMAKEHHAIEVVLITVSCGYDWTFVSDDVFVDPEKINEACDIAFSKKLDEAKKVFDDAGVKVKAIMISGGDPAKEILKYVEENDIERIIVGNKGLNPLSGLIGSVAYSILKNATVPVTLVK
ncbi:universal stress protein [Thermodesulfobium sp. 4217-1]|uniref:universal stress protein n=1 Tax=Thermodesulfobium sp. 4217-1 TaxID=3120013 RepID=UPI003221EB28